MHKDRPEKLSERIEVRLPYSDKQRFLEACRKVGEVPSEVLRLAMQDYVVRVEAAEKPTLTEDLTMTFIRNPLKTLSMAAASLMAVTLFTATPSIADEALFETFDRNQDGKIDGDEVSGDIVDLLDANRSSAIDPKEFQAETIFRGIMDQVRESPDGDPVREVTYTIRQVKFAEEYEASLNVWSCSETIEPEATQSEVDTLVTYLKETCEADKDLEI